MNVHLLEPDGRLRRRLRHFLESRGIHVTESDDLAGARKACARVEPTAIVAELILHPDDLVPRLRDIAPDAPVLVWTRRRDPDLPSTLRRLGCGLVAKPALSSEVAFELGRLAATHAPDAIAAAPGRVLPRMERRPA